VSRTSPPSVSSTSSATAPHPADPPVGGGARPIPRQSR
jgi:hypothetical protein